MITIGLTGGIGMGKSTVARQFAAMGAKICDADAIVHSLLKSNGAAFSQVAKAFPSAIQHGVLDRKALGKVVFADALALQTLEGILHPLVQAEEHRFIAHAKAKGATLAVIEIPLLFETAGHKRFDYTVAVSSPRFLQHLRVMKRPGMARDKLSAILSRQLPNHKRTQMADFIIHTGLGRAYSIVQVKRIIQEITNA